VLLDRDLKKGEARTTMLVMLHYFISTIALYYYQHLVLSPNYFSVKLYLPI